MSARASLYNTNVTSEAVLHTSNLLTISEDQSKDYPQGHRPAHTAKQSLNSQQLSRIETEQLSFDEQINEYIQKCKRSSHNQRKKKFFKQRIYHPWSRSRENRKQKIYCNHQNVRDVAKAPFT